MGKIFQIIRKFFTLITFIALQAIALYFLYRYNNHHRAVGLGMANQITGWMNSKYANVDQYFHLKEESERIQKTNDSLMNIMKGNFLDPDTSIRQVVDSIPYDTLGHRRRYLWRDAEVVSNSVNFEKNYIQINRGSKQGVKDNMAVLSADLSPIGIVVNTSENFSQVMSLLHVQNRVNAMMKKTGTAGIVYWDGNSPLYLTMINVPRSDSINKGDSVLTGINSYNFPPNYLVGTVEDISPDKSTSFYILKIKPAANFYHLRHVFVVENLQMEEQAKLEEETRKKMDNIKN